MSKFDILKTAVTSRAARQLLLAQKHSPVILFAAGVAGVVGTVILASRATMKLDPLLRGTSEFQEDYDKQLEADQIGHEEHAKATLNLKFNAAKEIAQLYLPALSLGIVSIAALTGSHVVLTNRNLALSAGLSALTKAHNTYRARVAGEYGNDVDQRFAAEATKVTVTEKLANGKTSKRDEDQLTNRALNSPYVFVFDEQSRNFSTRPGDNKTFLTQAQQYANDKLRTRGHIFLNEVLDLVGLPRTEAGALTGWLWEKPGGQGDNYVSFGIYTNPDEEWIERFIDGKEKYALLDFNVDGPIYKEI